MSRNALLSLVEWVKRQQNKFIDANNGMEIAPQSISFDSTIKANDIKKIEPDTQGDD